MFRGSLFAYQTTVVGIESGTENRLLYQRQWLRLAPMVTEVSDTINQVTNVRQSKLSKLFCFMDMFPEIIGVIG